MPVNQYVHIDTYDYGASLSPVTLHDLLTDALVTDGTAVSCAEISVDSGTYVAVFTGALPANLIPAGTYRIRSAVSGAPLKRFVTLAGVDGETAYSRNDWYGDLATAAVVNAQVLDVLSVDTFNELAAPPAASSSLKDKLTWMFMWMRNKSTESTTQRKLYADDGTTVVSTEAMSDAAGTFTKGEQS